MPSLRDGSIANHPNTQQLWFLWGQAPGGMEQGQDPCGQCECVAWRRWARTSLLQERSDGALGSVWGSLPWGTAHFHTKVT